MALAAWLQAHKSKLVPETVAPIQAALEQFITSEPSQEEQVPHSATHVGIHECDRITGHDTGVGFLDHAPAMDVEAPPHATEALPGAWQWPSDADAVVLVSVSISSHLESQGRSQKSIPRSLVHETLQTLHWLSTIAEGDPDQVPAPVRLAAYLLLIRAPSALWPLPGAQDYDIQGRCKPYARVRAARANLDLIHAGRWLEVLVPDRCMIMSRMCPCALPRLPRTRLPSLARWTRLWLSDFSAPVGVDGWARPGNSSGVRVLLLEFNGLWRPWNHSLASRSLRWSVA
eukprot:6491927-Amphidinium_carterae.3